MLRTIDAGGQTSAVPFRAPRGEPATYAFSDPDALQLPPPVPRPTGPSAGTTSYLPSSDQPRYSAHYPAREPVPSTSIAPAGTQYYPEYAIPEHTPYTPSSDAHSVTPSSGSRPSTRRSEAHPDPSVAQALRGLPGGRKAPPRRREALRPDPRSPGN